MTQIYTILFDLDGTIVNTAPDLMAAHNHVMRKYGHSEKKMEDIKSFSHLEGASVKKNVVVGPYARLREGTVLQENTKIGNFVETKKSIIGKNSKANHLTYIGVLNTGDTFSIFITIKKLSYQLMRQNFTV